MNRRFPLPKPYWACVVLCAVFTVLLFANIFRTDSWTGDIPFSQYTKNEWMLLALFLLEELLLVLLMLMFAFMGGKLWRIRELEMQAERERNKFDDVEPEAYDYVWFDRPCCQRALIQRQGEKFELRVHEYDIRTGKWEATHPMYVFESLGKVKELLLFEFEFFCAENADCCVTED